MFNNYKIVLERESNIIDPLPIEFQNLIINISIYKVTNITV